MTEKQFNITTDEDNLIVITNDEEIMTPYEVCDLLNALHEENEQLKKQLSDDFNQSNCITVQKSIISDLKKENLDLSEELDYYKTKCASLETGLFQAERETEQLKENCKNYNWYKQYKTLLNENEQLKSTINTLTHDNTKMKKVLNTTKNENEQIKHLIKEAYQTERTHIGKNTLKQLMEAIQ